MIISSFDILFLVFSSVWQLQRNGLFYWRHDHLMFKVHVALIVSKVIRIHLACHLAMHYRLGSHAFILVKLLHMVSHFAFCPAIDRHLMFLIKLDNPFLHFIHHDLHFLLKPLFHPLVCSLLYHFTLLLRLFILVEQVFHRKLLEYIL